MLVPLSWLRDFAAFDLDPVELGAVFDSLGMVVEAVTRVGGGLEGVVVAKVAAIEPIEGADKIRKVIVDAGTGTPVQIVCGAWNFEAGDSVPLAPVGTVLPGDFRITQRKMKGVVSDGMLCSARELDLGDDTAGLLVLPPGLTPGQPITEALGIEPDVVYDLAIEGNRPDANSVVGVARDAAARLGLAFANPSAAPFAAELETGDGDAGFRVEVSAPELCDRFTATVFSGVQVGPSPDWVARRLTLAGMRPISNVVDASNYVMLELGQPTHAYDIQRLPVPALGARAARLGERLTTLDDVERVLGTGSHPDCVITDGNDAAIGIGGVMGGASSEVHDETTSVVLEAAHFTPMAIARTSKRLGLRSEASARFERGTDPEGIDASVARFAGILAQTCPDLKVDGEVDWRSPGMGSTSPIRLRIDRANAVLGTRLSVDDAVRLLTPIGFRTEAAGSGLLDVTPPTFRPDATTEIDVIEEVARHHGYANIAPTTVRPPQVGRLTDHQKARRFTREILAGAGLSEAVTSPLLGPGDHARAGLEEDGITAVDPLVKEESVLRTSLLPGLLRAVAFNTDRRQPDVALFEIGQIWQRRPPAGPNETLPVETETLAVIVAGASAEEGAPVAVRLLRRLAAAFHVEDLDVLAASTAGLHPTRTATVLLAARPAGYVGEVDPAVTAAWGIPGRVAWLEIGVESLFATRSADPLAAAVSRFPSADLDLAFVVGDAVAAGSVERALRLAGGDVLDHVALFDVYRGEGLPPAARSLAFRLRFVAQDHTLTDAELVVLRDRAIAAATSIPGVTLRT